MNQWLNCVLRLKEKYTHIKTTFMHHATSNYFSLPSLPPFSFLYSFFFFALFEYNLPISNFVSFFSQLEGIESLVGIKYQISVC